MKVRRSIHMWLVRFYQNGQQITPTWEVESRIKPTRWTRLAFPGAGYSYMIEDTGLTPEQYYDQQED